jgi:hypothetical protein
MNAELMRKHAEHCTASASKISDDTLKARLMLAAKAWRSLADAKDQLDLALMGDEPALEPAYALDRVA